MSGNLFSWGARSTDPHTSHMAAEAHPALRSHDRRMTLLIHAKYPAGLTDFELGDLVHRQQTSVGVRRHELRNAGLIEATDTVRPAPSGSPAIVWRITPAGMLAARAITRELRANAEEKAGA